MAPHLSQRVARMPNSIMLSLADKVREFKNKGLHIIDLSLGQPEEPPPSHIAEALAKAAFQMKPEYENSSGMLELREAIALKLNQDDGSTVDPNRIIVTSGAKHGLLLSFMAVIEEGAEILLPSPTFPAYKEMTYLLGGSPVYYRLDPSKGWGPSISEIDEKITRKTRLLVLNYPHNPTGWEPDKLTIRRILEIASKYDLYVLSDEPYEKIIINDKLKHYHLTFFSEFCDKCIMVNSFSKTYGMISYRLGYLVAPPHLIEHLIKLQRVTITNVSPIIQNAGLAALKGPQDYITKRLRKYQQRIAMGLKVLRDLGFECVEPAGGFYLFPKLTGPFVDSDEFAHKLLEEERIAVTPGRVFGDEWHNYFRIALTCSDEELSYAFNRMTHFISRYV